MKVRVMSIEKNPDDSLPLSIILYFCIFYIFSDLDPLMFIQITSGVKYVKPPQP